MFSRTGAESRPGGRARYGSYPSRLRNRIEIAAVQLRLSGRKRFSGERIPQRGQSTLNRRKPSTTRLCDRHWPKGFIMCGVDVFLGQGQDRQLVVIFGDAVSVLRSFLFHGGCYKAP
jgi:hypothetical protein